MNGRARRLVVLAAAALACVALVGCWPLSSAPTITVKATFDDVADMATGAPVSLADIPIGSVSSIHLNGQMQAALTLRIKESARVPANVVAKVRRTTPLGEKFVSLEIPKSGPKGLLRDGETITSTEVVPDLQDLVSAGTNVFAALSGSQLGTILDEGATAFGQQGQQLRQVIADLDDLSKGYAGRTQTMVGVIDDLNQLASDLGPNSAANAQMITNLAQTTKILSDQSDHFLDLVDSFNRLATQGTSLLQTHYDHISTDIGALKQLTDTVVSQDTSLDRLLTWLPRHNLDLASLVRNNRIQVAAGVILCNLPVIGGEVPGDPLNGCHPKAGQ